MFPVFLALGSNIGDRKAFLEKAIKAVSGMAQTRVLRLSSVYETHPWGLKDQGLFLNQVCEINTGLSPLKLLTACLEIENSLGRRREERWGPRTIDIDLLLYGRKIIEEDMLQVPHPLLAERRFVLVPLAELAPAFFIDKWDKTVGQLLENCPEKDTVSLY